METFRLLHVSDLHMAKRPRRVVPPCSHSRSVARVLLEKTIPELLPGIDAVLITGDLANFGYRQDLETAKGFVDDLKGLGLDVAILPGNHDRYNNELFEPGAGQFDCTFSGEWVPGRNAFLLPDKNGERLALICGDLSLARKEDEGCSWGYVGQGRAYPERVDALKQKTHTVRAEHSPVGIVWAVHFAPEPHEAGVRHNLLEEGLFVDAAQEVGVSHIFCGHTHVPKGRYKAACNPSVEVHRAGTATQRFSRNAIHLVDVRVNGDKVEQVGWTDLFWDREEKLFRP